MACAYAGPPPRSVAVLQLGPGRVEPDDLGPERGEPARRLALAAPDVEDPPAPCEVPVDQRQDLLLVLGVGAVGEPLLPPTRLLFPQRPVVHGPIVSARTLDIDSRSSADRAGSIHSRMSWWSQTNARRALAVALAGVVIAAAIVLNLVDAARPDAGRGREPYVTLYAHDRNHVEALLVSGDGQAFAALAQDPLLQRPSVIAADGEYAYRAQRPLWGYLAWAASGGQADLVGWALVVLAILACGAACGVGARLLLERGASPWWALGIIAAGYESLATLTPELFALALFGGGLLLWARDRRGVGDRGDGGRGAHPRDHARGRRGVRALGVRARRRPVRDAVPAGAPLRGPGGRARGVGHRAARPPRRVADRKLRDPPDVARHRPPRQRRPPAVGGPGARSAARDRVVRRLRSRSTAVTRSRGS